MTIDPSSDRPILVEFEELYRLEVNRVIGLLLSLGATRDLAQDATQEAFLEGQRRWEQVRQYDRPGAWIRKIAVQRFHNASKHGQHEIPSARAPDSGADLAEDARLELTGEIAEVWQAVRALPRRQCEVTVLRYLWDFRVNEIADVLGITPGSVKKHLHLARRRLAVQLGEDDQGGTR